MTVSDDALVVRRLRLNDFSGFGKGSVRIGLKVHRFSRPNGIVHLVRRRAVRNRHLLGDDNLPDLRFLRVRLHLFLGLRQLSLQSFDFFLICSQNSFRIVPERFARLRFASADEAKDALLHSSRVAAVVFKQTVHRVVVRGDCRLHPALTIFPGDRFRLFSAIGGSVSDELFAQIVGNTIGGTRGLSHSEEVLLARRRRPRGDSQSASDAQSADGDKLCRFANFREHRRRGRRFVVIGRVRLDRIRLEISRFQQLSLLVEAFVVRAKHIHLLYINPKQQQ